MARARRQIQRILRLAPSILCIRPANAAVAQAEFQNKIVAKRPPRATAATPLASAVAAKQAAYMNQVAAKQAAQQHALAAQVGQALAPVAAVRSPIATAPRTAPKAPSVMTSGDGSNQNCAPAASAPLLRHRRLFRPASIKASQATLY